jgi:hypothetical protein
MKMQPISFSGKFTNPGLEHIKVPGDVNTRVHIFYKRIHLKSHCPNCDDYITKTFLRITNPESDSRRYIDWPIADEQLPINVKTVEKYITTELIQKIEKWFNRY